MTPTVDVARVRAAYAALATGDREKIREFFADDMMWLVPGGNKVSGLKTGLDGFLAFMGTVGRLSGNSFHMEEEAILIGTDPKTGDALSADVTDNTGRLAADATKNLRIHVIHYLRWRNGKVVDGRGAIFGDGTQQYDEFWGPAARQ
jgi:ketosteroid isomerase-like protein